MARAPRIRGGDGLTIVFTSTLVLAACPGMKATCGFHAPWRAEADSEKAFQPRIRVMEMTSMGNGVLRKIAMSLLPFLERISEALRISRHEFIKS